MPRFIWCTRWLYHKGVVSLLCSELVSQQRTWQLKIWPCILLSETLWEPTVNQHSETGNLNENYLLLSVSIDAIQRSVLNFVGSHRRSFANSCQNWSCRDLMMNNNLQWSSQEGMNSRWALFSIIQRQWREKFCTTFYQILSYTECVTVIWWSLALYIKHVRCCQWC